MPYDVRQKKLGDLVQNDLSGIVVIFLDFLMIRRVFCEQFFEKLEKILVLTKTIDMIRLGNFWELVASGWVVF